ncbi:hypothetical protein P4641_09220 [Halalkalibacterium halodurans]|uniref:hypothetical protein n=1 Tax=Halalkalibacterium halodurans TaxID=86665 RepID=UPI002E22FB95|nr:hypothetical protein [Halalkalibacterium halodurans]
MSDWIENIINALQLKDWISVTINVLLLIVTLATVRYASKTLLMEYSSQVTVSRYSRSINWKKYHPFSWEVEINNVGKGYIVKAFILLSAPSSKISLYKQLFLSKPIVGLKPNEKRKLVLSLKKEHAEKTRDNFVTNKLEVIYQDALDNIYVVSLGNINNHSHLESFDKLPKKVSKYSLKYWMYKMKLQLAIIQKNSYPERVAYEREEIESNFKNLKFELLNDKDTK